MLWVNRSFYMPDDLTGKNRKNGTDETAEKAALIQEIMQRLKDMEPEDQKNVYNMLILLFERQNQ